MGFSEDEIKEYQELYEAFSQDKEGNDRGKVEIRDENNSCHYLSHLVTAQGTLRQKTLENMFV